MEPDRIDFAALIIRFESMTLLILDVSDIRIRFTIVTVIKNVFFR
jgi:hypothetical protein